MIGSWWFLVSSVVSEIIEFSLNTGNSVVGGSVFQPWSGGVDPGKKIGGESFVLVHQGFIALVDLKSFGDSIGSLFGLKVKFWDDIFDKILKLEKRKKIRYLLVTSESVVKRGDISHDGSFVRFCHFDKFCSKKEERKS